VLPEQDAVVVTTAATENIQGILDTAWAHLLPAYDGGVSEAEDRRLADRLAGLALRTPPGAPPTAAAYAADAWVSATGLADHADGSWSLSLLDHGWAFDVRCGSGEFVRSNVPAGSGLHLLVEGSGGWLDADTFVADLVMGQTPHRLQLTFTPRTATSSATWYAVPLRTQSLLGLATGVQPAER
jgi:hypothetical protein